MKKPILNLFGATAEWQEIFRGVGTSRLFTMTTDIGSYRVLYAAENPRVMFSKSGHGKGLTIHELDPADSEDVLWQKALVVIQNDYDKRKPDIRVAAYARPAPVIVKPKKKFSVHYDKSTDEHVKDMITLVDRMFDAHEPFVLTINRDNSESVIVTGDFDLTDNGHFNITAEARGWNRDHDCQVCTSIGRGWSIHIDFDGTGKITRTRAVICSYSVTDRVVELINLARRKKDKSHLEHARRRIYECERVQGKPWAANPRKVIFGRIATAEAWIDRQPIKKAA